MVNPEIIARRGRLYEAKKKYAQLETVIEQDVITLRTRIDLLAVDSPADLDVEAGMASMGRIFAEVRECRTLGKLINELQTALGEAL